MAGGDTNRQSLKRYSWLPDRDDGDNGTLIAGQEYDDVFFAGGEIMNVTMSGVSFSDSIAVTGNITATGTITGSNLSGTNTGDQTITLTGDVTGSGTGSFATTLATVNSDVGTYGSTTLIPSITVNAKGLITAVSTNTVTVAIDDSAFEVIEGTNSQDCFASADAALLKARGTEVLGGTGAVTFTVGTTTFDVAATQGQIKDSTGYYAIDYAGATGVSVISTIVSSIYVYIDKAGTLQQQTTVPTCEEYREKLFLTRLALSGGTLAAQENLSNPSGQYTNSLRDYLGFVQSPKLGMAISGNASLTFKHAAGSIFELGSNNASNPDCPNVLEFAAIDPITFFYFDQDSTLSTSQTNINVTQYDSGGSQVTMTNNRFKIETVYKFGSGNVAVQMGQNEYTSLDAAQTAISTRTFVQNPALANGTRLGWIIVQKNATDLTDTATARFIQDNGSFSTSTGSVGALIASDNLSDVASASTSFDNIKQAATTTSSGVSELADATETQTGTDTQRTVTPSGLHATILGSVDQSWTDVSGSRSSGVTYTNSTGRLIFVIVDIGTSSSNNSYDLEINGNLICTPINQGANANYSYPIFIPVANGETYEITVNTGTIDDWWEFR